MLCTMCPVMYFTVQCLHTHMFSFTASPSLINPDEESVYLCGNSTGLQPFSSKDAIDRQMEVWAKW